MLLLLLVSGLFLMALFLVPLLWFRVTRAARMTSAMPGPKPLPIIGNAREFGSNTVEMIANMIRMCKEYGTCCRIWLGPSLFVLLAEPKHAEVILSSNTEIKKNMTYRFLEPWLGKGLLTSTGKKWHSRRKIITPTFHFKILEQFVDVFNSNGDIMIKKLKKEVNGPDFDIYNYVTLCALDNICETAMGVSMNAQDDSESEYVVAIKELANVVMKRTFSPWLFPNFIFNLSQLGRDQKRYLKVLHDTTINVIVRRKEELLKERDNKSENKPLVGDQEGFGEKKRLAFLDLLMQHSQDGVGLSDEDIREETDTFMFEGHDTTASGITFCLYLLSQHPIVQDKVVQEMKEVLGDLHHAATFRDLQQLKYLERVIKESLRIYPSVPFFARELENDLQLEGLRLPAGTNILFLVFMMNRHPEHFPDPEKFDPDRFLPENIQGKHPYAYVPFSAGPRNCVGQKFAMLEMKSTISKVLLHYRLLPSDHPIILSTELVLRSSGGVKVRLEPRQ